MKVKGICKDCEYRWQLGAKGQPKHLYCNRPGSGRVVKNLNMKSCPYYQKASDAKMKILRKVSQVR